ncbi:VOC family protein [Rossellomorea sp. NPDC077527]|uniref:VOC family protein n=1 Tax=Rossellomorea sp. NPDC077527 TaxID=3364510 RepID=UPI0037C87EEF
MIYEMTVQVRVKDMSKGQAWYKILFNREPDFIPHKGFAEWQILQGCWLQVAEGNPSPQSGPIRLGIESIRNERVRLKSLLNIDHFEIHEREEVPVKWATFQDPWGNGIGLFEYRDRSVMKEQIELILGKDERML